MPLKQDWDRCLSLPPPSLLNKCFQANYNLGYAYEHGEGVVASDSVLARKYYQLAAEQQAGGAVAGLVVQISLWKVWFWKGLTEPGAMLISMGVCTVIAMGMGVWAYYNAAAPRQPPRQSTNQPANQAANQPTNQAANQPTNQPANHPVNQLAHPT